MYHNSLRTLTNVVNEFAPSYFGPFRAGTQVQTDFSTKIPSMLRQVFSMGYNASIAYGTKKNIMHPKTIVYDQDVEVKNGVLLFGNGAENNGK
ncbi:MAG: hypothetical protein Ta2F_07260 [Termitinemataceae bacterium]|nr:MAG: hypothetical protein Ta2F_07260 [Termitinemataceae bacterium]